MSIETVNEAPPVVNVTESAALEIKAKIQAEGETSQGKFLRVFVEAGGCSGMQYGMVFDEERPNDFVARFHGVGVVVDPFSAEKIRGSVIDFVDSLTGGGFKISNPKARQSCGCGKSFEA